MELEHDNIIKLDLVENKQLLNEEADAKRINDWMECWKNKKFPHNTEYKEYSDWCKFRDFWLTVYPELPLKVAHQIYLLKQKENVK